MWPPLFAFGLKPLNALGCLLHCLRAFSASFVFLSSFFSNLWRCFLVSWIEARRILLSASSCAATRFCRLSSWARPSFHSGLSSVCPSNREWTRLFAVALLRSRHEAEPFERRSAFKSCGFLSSLREWIERRQQRGTGVPSESSIP